MPRTAVTGAIARKAPNTSGPADITGVQYLFATGERRQGFWPDEAVGVRNDADETCDHRPSPYLDPYLTCLGERLPLPNYSRSAVQDRILVTGASGYVGRAVVRASIAAGYRVTGTYHGQPPADPAVDWVFLDLRDPRQVADTIIHLAPRGIIHAAAAWNTPEEARLTIVEGTAAVADAAVRVAARLVHISTDVLFDGEHAPYREADGPDPIIFYGSAKADAEEIVAATVDDYVIVRTSLVTDFDAPDPRTAIVLDALMAAQTTGGAATTAPLTLFTDEYRCPVLTADLAAALAELIDHPYRGVLNVAGPQRMSRYELGQRIARYYRLTMDGTRAGTVVGSGLVRPRDCTLDTSLARAILRTVLSPIPDPEMAYGDQTGCKSTSS